MEISSPRYTGCFLILPLVSDSIHGFNYQKLHLMAIVSKIRMRTRPNLNITYPYLEIVVVVVVVVVVVLFCFVLFFDTIFNSIIEDTYSFYAVNH